MLLTSQEKIKTKSHVNILKLIFNCLFILWILPVVVGLCANAFILNGKTTSYVNFREGPGTKYKIIRALPSGTNIKISKKSINSKWYHISWKDKQGYISSKYVDLITKNQTRSINNKNTVKNKFQEKKYRDTFYDYTITLSNDWQSIDIPAKKNSKKVSQKRFFFISPDGKVSAMVWAMETSRSLKKFNEIFFNSIYKGLKPISVQKGPNILDQKSKELSFVTKDNKKGKLWSFVLQIKQNGQKKRTAYAVEFVSKREILKRDVAPFQNTWQFASSVKPVSGLLRFIENAGGFSKKGTRAVGSVLVSLAFVLPLCMIVLIFFYPRLKLYFLTFRISFRFKILIISIVGVVSGGTYFFFIWFSANKSLLLSINLSFHLFVLALILLAGLIKRSLFHKINAAKKETNRKNSDDALKAKKRLENYKKIEKKYPKETLKQVKMSIEKIRNYKGDDNNYKKIEIEKCLQQFPESIDVLILTLLTGGGGRPAHIEKEHFYHSIINNIVALEDEELYDWSLTILYIYHNDDKSRVQYKNFLAEELAYAKEIENLCRMNTIFELMALVKREEALKTYSKNQNLKKLKTAYSESLSLFIEGLNVYNALTNKKSVEYYRKVARKKLKNKNDRRNFVTWFEKRPNRYPENLFTSGLPTVLGSTANSTNIAKPLSQKGASTNDTYFEVTDSFISGMDNFIEGGVLYYMNSEVFDIFGGDIDTAEHVIDAVAAVPALADSFDLGAVGDVGSGIGDLVGGFELDFD